MGLDRSDYVSPNLLQQSRTSLKAFQTTPRAMQCWWIFQKLSTRSSHMRGYAPSSIIMVYETFCTTESVVFCRVERRKYWIKDHVSLTTTVTSGGLFLIPCKQDKLPAVNKHRPTRNNSMVTLTFSSFGNKTSQCISIQISVRSSVFPLNGS